MRPKADTDDDAITASQRLQANLQKMIDEVEAEEEQDKEMTDTQVALRRYGLSRAQEVKTQGNSSFKLRNFPDAIRKYTSALDILDQLDEECGRTTQYNHPLVKDRWALRAIALSNRSECHLQMKRWEPALADTEAALEIDPFNDKALSRRRRARESLVAAEADDTEKSSGEQKQKAKRSAQSTGNNKVDADKYVGPTFWEVCEEQWPRTFRILGRIWAVFRRFRGLIALAYVVLTFYGVRHLWRTRLFGLLGVN